MTKTFSLFELPAHVSKSGNVMHVLETTNLIPFEVKRFYFIVSKSEGGATGEHCHFVEEEIFFLSQGSAKIVIDRGEGKEEIQLFGGKNGVYIPAYVWHGFKDLSADAIICAISSTNYNPDRSDYLEDYQAYLPLRDQHLA